MNRNGLYSGSENIDYSSANRKRFGGSKLFLLIASITAAVCDLVLLIVCSVSGFDARFIVLPVFNLIFDALFIVGIVFTNFRFRYSLTVWIVYLALTFIFACSTLGVMSGGELTYSTGAATALFAVAHAVSFVAVTIAALYPILKKKPWVKATVIAMSALTVAISGAYSVYIMDYGFLGQGYIDEYRSLAFKYDQASDSYFADGVLKGRSDKVRVPLTFNGKDVTAVSYALFADASIASVEIVGEKRMRLYDEKYYLGELNDTLKLGVNKKLIDSYRQELYSERQSVVLANNVYPTGLADDEAYVTFAYNADDLILTDNSYIPTWIGKKGNKFDLSFCGDKVDYVKYSDKSDDEDLYWNYQNNGYMLKEIVTSQGNLQGVSIVNNVVKAQVNFERVFAVEIGDGNDTKFSFDDSIKTIEAGGSIRNYRLTALSRADELLRDLSREGFDIKWKCGVNEFSSLADYLRRNANGHYNATAVEPEWTLKKPYDGKITPNAEKYVYGDTLILSAAAKAPKAGYDLSYSWYCKDAFMQSGAQMIYDRVLPSMSGAFSVIVVATSEETSLSSQETFVIDVSVDKKALDFVWTDFDQDVYDGENKEVYVDYDTSQLIEGDGIDYAIYNHINSDAGRYTANIELTVGADCYKIGSGGSFAYEILPMEVEAVWSDTQFVYDGSYKAPNATVTGIAKDGQIQTDVTGAGIDAGAYVAKVSTANGNYTIVNRNCDYVIERATVTAKWAENVQLVYAGAAQHPDLMVIGALDRDKPVPIDYYGYENNVNVGDGYTVGADLPIDGNYRLDAPVETSYSIVKREVRVVWDEKYSKFVYDGQNHNARVSSITNAVANQQTAMISSLKYTSAQLNVGKYTAQVALGCVYADNYQLIGDDSKDFEITKRTLVAKAVASAKTYDGKTGGNFGFTLSGLATKDKKEDFGMPIYGGGAISAKNAGKYTLTLSLPESGVINNYDVKYESCDFIIKKKSVALQWNTASGIPTIVKDGKEYSSDIKLNGYAYYDSKGRLLASAPTAVGNYSVSASVSSVNYEFTNTLIDFKIERKAS